jgi:hypothetical protein
VLSNYKLYTSYYKIEELVKYSITKSIIDVRKLYRALSSIRHYIEAKVETSY